MAQGDNIKCLRTREGLTQQQFADMLGVTKETVCRWERGHTAVKVSTLDKLTELFDVRLMSSPQVIAALLLPA